MGKRKTYSDEEKERAKSLMMINRSVKDISAEMGISEATLHLWKREIFEKDDDFAKLRVAKKREFVNKSWRLIEKAQKLIEKKLDLADKNDEVLSKEDLRALTTALGTMYDKQALANKEATEIVESETIVRFEDL